MSRVPEYMNEELDFERRAEDIVSRMSLEEKVSQMLYNAPAIPRLGIPSYNWWNECLHGVARAGVATVFPQAIGMAATFDESLIHKIADVISDEGRAKYHQFQSEGDHDIYKGLTFWAPNINIFRDPRWGRGHETYGEDPYLTGRLGVAFVKGLQGKDPKYLKTVATPKHYAVHSGPENERHSFDAVVSEKDLRETYLPAFKECVKEAGAESVMGAYNRTNGEPCCGSITLLQRILKDEWGFKGYVVSDCWAVSDFHLHHHVTATAPESAAMAVNNGCDLNCGKMFGNLLAAIEEGLIEEKTIDKAVTRLMTARFKLGMFDNPENVKYAGIQYDVNDSDEHICLALDAARRSIVLLKNENKLLPLDRDEIKSIAVIGPNADSRNVLMGNYSGTSSRSITVLEGIRGAVNTGTRIYYSEGCHLYRDKVEGLAQVKDRFSEAVSAAKMSDVAVVCLGLDGTIEGEQGDVSNEYGSGDKPDLNLPGLQQKLLEAVYDTGKPVILVLMSGSALAISWADENIPGILQAWYPGGQGGKAVADVIFGEYSPSGRLPVTFYRTSEELPDFKDYSMKNRTYRYMKNEALYPFGYGLSYTSFKYDNLILGKSIKVEENMECSVTVSNNGDVSSREAIQLYLRDVEASVDVPRWQLKGVKIVELAPGESEKVSFLLTPRQMALIDNNGRCLLEPGEFEVFIGGSQPDARSEKLTGTKVLKGTFEVVGETVLLEY